MSPQHFDHCDDAVSLSIRVQTTLNHSRFGKYDRLKVARLAVIGVNSTMRQSTLEIKSWEKRR